MYSRINQSAKTSNLLIETYNCMRIMLSMIYERFYLFFPRFYFLYIYAHIYDNRRLTKLLKSNLYILLMFYTLLLDHDVLPFRDCFI